jgi:alkylhydroperoxidase family enzyme
VRLPLLRPDELRPDQEPLHAAFRQRIEQRFTAFKAVREDGALLGPWSVWIHEPQVGEAVRPLLDSIGGLKRLPASVKEIAILAVGARFKAAYELYAHVALGARAGLSMTKMAAVCAGQRPADLTCEEAMAFDVAMALLDGGVLPGATYQAARTLFGQAALNELIQIVALYAFVSITLNAYDVPGEESEANEPVSARVRAAE